MAQDHYVETQFHNLGNCDDMLTSIQLSNFNGKTNYMMIDREAVEAIEHILKQCYDRRELS